jgi:hypothetical protein
MATDIERLTVTLEANLNRLQKQMASAGMIVDRETKKAVTAANRNLKTIEDRTEQAAANVNRSLGKTGQGASQLGTRMQQAGYQIGDFAVQVASGQNALVALTQQGSQVLGAFGPWGAVIGAAGAVIGALLANLDKLGGSASVNAEDLKRFNAAMEDSKQSAAVAEEGYDALIAKLGQLTETSRRALVAQLQQNIETNEAALRAGAETLSGSVLDEDVWREIIRTVGSFGEAAKDARRDIYDLAQGIQEAPQDPTKYTQLADILRALATNARGEAAESFRELADKLDVAAGNAQALVEKNQKLETAQRLANGEVVTGAKAILDAGNNAVTASGQISGLADAVGGLGQSFSRLRAQQNFTKAGGFIKYDPKMGETPTIPDRPDLAKPYGETFPGVDPGQVALDELSHRFAYGSGSGEIKPKKTSTKKTPEDRADSRLDSLKAEIELNTKLLAAYALGDEAMAKIKAQYAAINSARQLGLKEGTAEYNDYLSNAQAAETENAALEARLKLMADGKSLTVEMQTEQEKLNAKLVEYKALLDAGAITQTTYERAVAKAKDQNDSLAESIGAVGDAITAGIQGAVSFSDALLKIGMQLLNLLSKGLFGQGPLGGLLNNVLGVASGGLLGLAGGGGAATATQGVMNGTGFRRSFAGGGMAGPGVIRVGETGPELLSLSQRGHVTPANATRRLTGGAGGASKIDVTVSGARGSAEIQQAVAAGMEIAYRRAVAAAPGAVRQHNVRYGA